MAMPDPAAGPILSYSCPWPEASLLSLLRSAEGQPRLFWESERSELAFAAFGIAAQIAARGPHRFSEVADRAQSLFQNLLPLDRSSPAAIPPLLVGGFSFFPQSSPRDPFWRPFPAAWFILPRVQVTRRAGETWLTLHHQQQPGEHPDEIARTLRERAQDLIWQGLPEDPASPDLEDHPAAPLPQAESALTFRQWVSMARQVIARIRSGELQKAVLARVTHVNAARPICFPRVLARLGARYPDCYRFLFEPIPGRAFFGASPELLAEVAAQRLNTVALAGSIQRGRTWEEDQRLGQHLLANSKERLEHDLVVRSLATNLTPLTAQLDVPSVPELCLLNNIQHLLTPITGRITNGKGILPIIQTLHPTPALGGSPRAAALALIERLEPLPRGWYGAPFGWLAPDGDGEFAVAIRSAIAHQNRLRLYAGAGIVADSDPAEEWRETGLKFQPILQALPGE